MEILTYPDGALSTDWTHPKWFIDNDELKDPAFKHLIDCMTEEMYLMKALGLAANQLGEPAPIFVIDMDGDPFVAINPSIAMLENMENVEEACLSLPGISAKVSRAKRVRLIYISPEGQKCAKLFEGQQAQAVQHEMDHLLGKLYWDHLSSMKRSMLKRRFNKIHKHKT